MEIEEIAFFECVYTDLKKSRKKKSRYTQKVLYKKWISFISHGEMLLVLVLFHL
jgi:hypothetical protein